MSKNIIFLFLISGLFMMGQSQKNANIETYTSRKGIYELKYDPKKWIRADSSEWDVQFNDKYNLVTVYFMEYDYFITDKKLKSVIEDQYKEYGKIKNLKIYKKKINNLTVNYFECDLNYNDILYKYQGFTYNGKGGSIQMQFGAQAEAIEPNQGIIDELNNGLFVVE